MLELFDLTRLQAGDIAVELFPYDWHQEVERDDVYNCHREYRSIREVDDGAKAGGRTDNNEDARLRYVVMIANCLA